MPLRNFPGNSQKAYAATQRVCQRYGLKFPDLGETRIVEMSWRDLHQQRIALRHLSKDLAAKLNADKSSPEEHEAADLELATPYIIALAQDRSDEIDKRSADGFKEPEDFLRDLGRATRSTGPQFQEIGTKRVIRGLRANDRIASGFPDAGGETRDEGLSIHIGDYIAGVVTGRWRSSQAEAEARAMSVGELAGGGYAVPNPLSQKFIDLARAQSVVMRAGAVTVPMDSATLDIARLERDPQFNWTAENAEITSADLTLGRVRFQARKVAALIKMSIELFEDSPNIGDIIQQALVQAAALELDRVALVGDGSNNQPTGIFRNASQNDMEMYALDAVFPNYDGISRIVQAIRTRNHEPNAMIWHPRTAGDADRLKDGDLQPLQPPPSVAALEKFTTTSIPINLGPGSPADSSIIIAGKFDELLVGMRREVNIEVSREAGEAFKNGQVWIRAILRADVQLARSYAFGVVTGVWSNP